MTNSYDCVIVGGGPAGTTVAALVAQAGFRTLLLEREKVPRFHIGESLMPETYWTFERLGLLDQMKSSAFPKKYSVQFVNNTGKESQPFYFFDRDQRECSQTWQVLRSEFDLMMWKNAAAKGAECREQTRVLDVLFEGDRARGVTVQDCRGNVAQIEARVTVDASGQQALLSNRLGLKQPNPLLRKAAVWGYYENARRDPGLDEGATLVLHTRGKDCWFWYIPLPENVVSIGVVGDVDYLLKGRGEPARVFEEELADCSSLAARLTEARLVSEFRVLREFSYYSSRNAGEGWVLTGDAYAFLDPIYSSGVFLALKSGEMAADAIIEGLRRGDLSAAQLGKWGEQFNQGLHWIGKLVQAFYTREFSFGKFVTSHPEHKNNLIDLLVGKVFHQGAGKIFDDMDPWIEQARTQEAAQARSAVADGST